MYSISGRGRNSYVSNNNITENKATQLSIAQIESQFSKKNKVTDEAASEDLINHLNKYSIEDNLKMIGYSRDSSALETEANWQDLAWSG